jgi:hypothetical protein
MKLHVKGLYSPKATSRFIELHKKALNEAIIIPAKYNSRGDKYGIVEEIIIVNLRHTLSLKFYRLSIHRTCTKLALR